ncbi:MAG: rhomboid family intramembrane serine protease [Ignavibacteriales bacterium]|nr:MAG: rhomboid family intramembrane serine protease [Ignavibacteriales bacterium]
MNNYYRPSGFGGFSFFPPVIKNLLIINAAIFFVQILGDSIAVSKGVSLSSAIIKYFALIPLGVFADASFYPWQLISYQFLHGGFGHIFFNMFALWMFGMEIENTWGSKKFLYYYLLSGIGAGLCHLFISPLLGGGLAPTIGASGAVYGVLIAFGLMFPNRYIFLYFFIPVKAKYLITFLILMEFMLVDSANSSVAHLAHLGGALTGFIFILFDKKTPVLLKDIFQKRPSFRSSKPFNPLGGFADKFKKKEENIQDAEYYEVKEEDKVTQEEIDRILDKISQSGYQNLTEKEKKILFQASKKMN